jgi:hypothetical protein
MAKINSQTAVKQVKFHLFDTCADLADNRVGISNKCANILAKTYLNL